MPFIDLQESQDRRLQMLLQTANQIQQNKIAREDANLRRQQLMQGVQENKIKAAELRAKAPLYAAQSQAYSALAGQRGASSQLLNNLNDMESGGLPSSGLVLSGIGPSGPRFENMKATQQREQLKADVSVGEAVKKDAMTRFNKLDELVPLLDQFDSQLKSVPVSKGIMGKAQGIGMQLAGKTGVDPFVATNVSQMDATSALAARAFGDVGNLTEQEQAKAKGFFAKVDDPLDTRALKSLGGLALLRRKVVQSAQKSGLSEDPVFQQKLSLIDQRISAKKREALDMGIDDKRLKTFLGEDFSSVANVFVPGERRSKNGIEYVRQEDGKWLPLSKTS